MRHAPIALVLFCLLQAIPTPGVAGTLPDQEGVSMLGLTLERAERALAAGELEQARDLLQRALERDRRSRPVWELLGRWAEAAGDRSQRVYALHRSYDLALVQGADRKELKRLKDELIRVDPLAGELFELRKRYLKSLISLAEQYEKSGRPHGAIRVWKEVAALDPENPAAPEAIERIAAAPDPSLAEDATPPDLFADVDEEWIAAYDAAHATWEEAGEEERENYITVTDAGYEVLIRTAEAMEQMSAFYRIFFHYGTEEDGHRVPRIRVHIFKTRDEYLTLGIGPPVEWSGGHFTGSAVETYVEGGFQTMVGTLFHEAAHQYVSMATRATGWLNEGLASFFEGTRILPNGTVIMNMPANHRLMPLAERMERGWMASASDGFDPTDPEATPEKAPTFRILIENDYAWGPAWYAPTWGLVYFLYNFQDPLDGRFVYRDALREYIDASGGKSGETAVETFTQVVLAHPKPPYDPRSEGALELPRTIEEVDGVWKRWILALRDEALGADVPPRPYGEWARLAAENGDYDAAREHYEKGLVADPGNVELLLGFADLLAERDGNTDRAAKLALEALHWLERADSPDEKRITKVERLLSKLDPKRRSLTRLTDQLGEALARLVERYGAAGQDLMVMEIAWRGYADLGIESLLEPYREAVARSGREPAIWSLAYDERDLEGWVGGKEAGFRPDGTVLRARMGEYEPGRYDFHVVTLDQLTRGDFSMEAEVDARGDAVTFAGIVFGHKGGTNFHAFLHFPARSAGEGATPRAWVDLITSSGGSNIRTWRHLPVPTGEEPSAGRSRSALWRRMRVDVVGRTVDLWFDGELVATHTFPSREVLFGTFGLVFGPGECAFRNVRFLARDPRDPASAILRAKRLEKLALSGGADPSGSWLGRIPPFPSHGRWIQSPRSSFEDRGPVPELIVLTSIDQNELIPIDGWLRYLAQENADVGLEIVTIVSMVDDERIESYLAKHPLPGSVVVDKLSPGESGIGRSFEQYHIARFNLPRLLLIDIDGKVLWEGDPGFPQGAQPVPPFASYLDDPLEELIVSHRLRALARWRKDWSESILPALLEGRFAEVAPALAEAEGLDSRVASVAQAQHILGALRSAGQDLPALAKRWAEDGLAPVLPVLLEWVSEVRGEELTSKELRPLKKYLSSKSAKQWQEALRACTRFTNQSAAPLVKGEELLAALGKLEGPLVESLRADLARAFEAGHADAVQELVREAPRRPARWLVGNYLGLGGG